MAAVFLALDPCPGFGPGSELILYFNFIISARILSAITLVYIHSNSAKIMGAHSDLAYITIDWKSIGLNGAGQKDIGNIVLIYNLFFSLSTAPSINSMHIKQYTKFVLS